MTSHGVTRITLVPYTYLEQLQRTVRGAGSPDQHGIRSHLTLTPFDRLLARLLCLLVNWVELKATGGGGWLHPFRGRLPVGVPVARPLIGVLG